MLPSYIENRLKRINIKSKRRRILLKKAMELKHLCGLEMLIIIKDTEFNKFTIYNSSEDSFEAGVVNQLTETTENSPCLDTKDKGRKQTRCQYVHSQDYQKMKRDRNVDADDNIDVDETMSDHDEQSFLDHKNALTM